MDIVLRATVMFFALFALLRLLGKRELGQMTPVDLVVILLIANAVQNAMVGPDVSLSGGILAAAVLSLSVSVALLTARVATIAPPPIPTPTPTCPHPTTRTTPHTTRSPDRHQSPAPRTRPTPKRSPASPN